MKKIVLTFVAIILLTIICLFTYEFYILPQKSIQEEQQLGSETNSDNNTENDNIIVEIPEKEDTKITMSVIGDIMCHNSG